MIKSYVRTMHFPFITRLRNDGFMSGLFMCSTNTMLSSCHAFKASEPAVTRVYVTRSKQRGRLDTIVVRVLTASLEG